MKDQKPRIVRDRRLRALVFKRDKGICSKCGRFDPKWVHEHSVALWAKGPDTLENSETHCRRHANEKTAKEATERAKCDRLRERSEMTKQRRAIVRQETRT